MSNSKSNVKLLLCLCRNSKRNKTTVARLIGKGSMSASLFSTDDVWDFNYVGWIPKSELWILDSGFRILRSEFRLRNPDFLVLRSDPSLYSTTTSNNSPLSLITCQFAFTCFPFQKAALSASRAELYRTGLADAKVRSMPTPHMTLSCIPPSALSTRFAFFAKYWSIINLLISSVLYLFRSIYKYLYLISFIFYLLSYILYPISFILYLLFTFHIFYPMSYTLYLISNISHFLSYLFCLPNTYSISKSRIMSPLCIYHNLYNDMLRL